MESLWTGIGIKRCDFCILNDNFGMLLSGHPCMNIFNLSDIIKTKIEGLDEEDDFCLREWLLKHDAAHYDLWLHYLGLSESVYDVSDLYEAEEAE